MFSFLQELITNWEGYVSSHHDYNTSYTSTLAWLNDLTLRVAACKDMAGDKAIIEEKQAALQVGKCTTWLLSRE